MVVESEPSYRPAFPSSSTREQVLNMRKSKMKTPTRRLQITSANENAAGMSWPTWARRVTTLALLIHMGAILTGAAVYPPYSNLEARLVQVYKYYFGLINQGYAYRFYSKLDSTVDPRSPRPWSTPIVIAELVFDRDNAGPSVRTVRIPEILKPFPRLRFQRQLDLAYHVSADPRWAASYARHLLKTYKCTAVTIFSQEHRIPLLSLICQAADGGFDQPLDLESAETYGPLINLGDFHCTDF